MILSALRTSADGKTLLGFGNVDDPAMGPTQSVVVAWDLSTGKQLFRRDAPVKAAAKCISPDSMLLFGSDGCLVETESGRQVLDLQTSFNYAFDQCIFSPDQSLLAGTQSESFQTEQGGGVRMKEVKIWEVSSGKILVKFAWTNWLGHLVFTHDGQHLIATDTDGIHIWKLPRVGKSPAVPTSRTYTIVRI